MSCKFFGEYQLPTLDCLYRGFFFLANTKSVSQDPQQDSYFKEF